MLGKISNQGQQEGRSAFMQISREIRKTDVALTSHMLELICQFSDCSTAVCNGQVGS